MNGTLNLTVYIPTYNRANTLLRLLESIQDIEYYLIDEIIISDNHSDYDIIAFLRNNLSEDFYSKCRVIINCHNIGGQGNINNSFFWSRTKWMWMIGDDDIVTKDSLITISKNIVEYPECAWFKFSTSNINAFEENRVINSLHEFIDYYTEKDRHKGNLVFMSNNIYNLDLLSPYIRFAYEYSYTFISQILPPLMGLDEQKFYIKYCEGSICNFSIPAKEQHWDCIKIFLGSSTFVDIPFHSLSLKKIKSLKQIFTFWSVSTFASWALNESDIESRIRYFKKIYRDFFLPAINVKDRILYFSLYIQIKYHINLYTLIRRIWRYLRGG